MLVARSADLLVGGYAVVGGELVEHVGVGGERHRGRVAGLARDLDHADALLDQQRNEAVAQVVWAWALDSGGFGRGCVHAASPVLSGGEGPRFAVDARENQPPVGWTSADQTPFGEVAGEWGKQGDGAGPCGLGGGDLAE
ncbi:MAG TPA: hypothetical protein VIM22_09545 [Solirubrobacteraceae bacterium]